MFGRKKAKENKQTRALLALGAKLDTLTGEILALRADIEKDRAQPEGERDPDVLTESERIDKWLNGENGDGI